MWDAFHKLQSAKMYILEQWIQTPSTREAISILCAAQLEVLK